MLAQLGLRPRFPTGYDTIAPISVGWATMYDERENIYLAHCLSWIKFLHHRLRAGCVELTSFLTQKYGTEYGQY